MEKINWKDIPIIEESKNGYYEIYPDRKIWHKDKYPPDYQFNREDDIEFPEQDETDLINQELSVASHENTMKLKPASNFVVPNKDVKTGDLITFLDEGKYNTLPQDPEKEVLTFKIEIPSGEEKSISINKTSQIELEKAWTDESSKWVGKQAIVKVVNQKVFKEFKDVIYLSSAEGTKKVPEEKLE